VIDHLKSGGAQEIVCQLIKYGQGGLFQPEVVTLYGNGHYWDTIRSWRVPVYSLSSVGFWRAFPLMATRLLRLLAHNRYDVVHTHLIGANVLTAPLAALYQVPVRLTHDHTNEDVRCRSLVLRSLDSLANRLNHHIIAVASSIRNFLSRQEGLPFEKISLIYNSVDLQWFSPSDDPNAKKWARRNLDLPQDALLVGGVGRLTHEKNFPLFLEVAAEVCARLPQARFVIAGEGSERKALEEKSRRLGLDSRLRFLGFVKDMPQFYQSLDLLLLTSHFEGTPLTVLEAMAMGVPVAASQVNGVAEVLEDGQDGILVPPGRGDLFIERICRVFQDRSLWHQFSRAGREKAQQRYSSEAMVRQVEALYLRYLKENGGL